MNHVLESFIKIRDTYNIEIRGVLHIGAHMCEEAEIYEKFGIADRNIVWIEANPILVSLNKIKGIKNIYQAVISNRSAPVKFNIASNSQSSSILELGTHAVDHPEVTYVDQIDLHTTTLRSFFDSNNLDPSDYNFWNLDIQGAELDAIKSGEEFLKHVDVVYTEVNECEVYRGCGLITEIDDLLAKYKFKRVETYMTPQGWGDAIYIKIK